MLDIAVLRSIVSDSQKVIISQHMLKRFSERHVKYRDIISVINSGEIIEQYPNDYPYPSCLILGLDISGKYMHIVCGTDGEYIWIITAYYPSEDKWEKDLKTRKV